MPPDHLWEWPQHYRGIGLLCFRLDSHIQMERCRGHGYGRDGDDAARYADTQRSDDLDRI